MEKTAVITGAGSGVGQAVARLLNEAGWRCALIGRTEAKLKETQRQLPTPSEAALFVADLSRPEEVTRCFRAVAEFLPRPEVLVNAAGTNTPRRSLQELPFEQYRSIVETNLTGAYLSVQALLPGMRQRRSGTIVNIVSDAARQASAKAGPAYVVSKFGLLGLTQSINAEERPNGIRACAILPGDINTPLLEKRPQVPDAASRERMLQPEDVAQCVWLAIQLPPRAVVEELLIRPGG